MAGLVALGLKLILSPPDLRFVPQRDLETRCNMSSTMTERVLSNKEHFQVVDSYLGFDLYQWVRHDTFHAKPQGWNGPVLGASSMPLLRKLIWRWWYQVQANG